MNCKQCGAENVEGTAFCQSCGKPLNEQQTGNYYQGQQSYQNRQSYQGQQMYQNQQSYQGQQMYQNQQPYQNQQMYQPQFNEHNIPEEYRPISMWGYFGYEILFSIPLIGFILLLVFAFGGTRNKNLKNFARSYFCFLIIVVILLLIAVGLGGTAAIFSTMN